MSVHRTTCLDEHGREMLSICLGKAVTDEETMAKPLSQGKTRTPILHSLSSYLLRELRCRSITYIAAHVFVPCPCFPSFRICFLFPTTSRAVLGFSSFSLAGFTSCSGSRTTAVPRQQSMSRQVPAKWGHVRRTPRLDSQGMMLCME